MSFDASSLVVTILGLLIALLSTVLVLRSTSFTIIPGSKGYSYVARDGQVEELYEDEDNTTTTDLDRSFSARLSKTVALVCALISVLLSTFTRIWDSLESRQGFLPEIWMLFCG